MEQRAEEARSRFQTDEDIRDKYDCFFKVVDVFSSRKRIEDRGECFHSRHLENFYNTVPPQPENAIRLILDGRHRRIHLMRDVWKEKSDSYPNCSSLLGSNHNHHTPSPCPLYSGHAVINDTFRYYHLPTLRRLMEEDGEKRWYGMSCFASHINGCPSLSRRLHPLQSTFERSDAYFTVCRDEKGLMTVICYAPDAYATPPDSRWDSYQCANANWRFLKELGISLAKLEPPLIFTDDCGKQALQFLLLKVIFVHLEQTATFLDYISSRMDDEDWRILPRDFFPLRETRLVSVLSERILVLRTVEDVMAHISGAVECVSRSIRLVYQDQALPASAAITTHLDSLQQDCNYYNVWTKQLKTKSIETHEVTVSRFNVKQASSVSQLTLLAAFFLPLSLAAGVLGMQTRFVELDLLLYDFVGVVVILATLALVFGIINRYCQDFIKLMIRGQEGRPGSFELPAFRYLRVIIISLWWLAILSSFLVGMMKDVVFGFKVFGFQAAGIILVGWFSYGLSGWFAMRDTHTRARE